MSGNAAEAGGEPQRARAGGGGGSSNRIQVSNTKKPLFFYVNLAKVSVLSVPRVARFIIACFDIADLDLPPCVVVCRGTCSSTARSSSPRSAWVRLRAPPCKSQIATRPNNVCMISIDFETEKEEQLIPKYLNKGTNISRFKKEQHN